MREVSFIGPALSAIGLVFGLASFFVFAPNKKLGCEMQPVDPNCTEDCEEECKTNIMKLFYAIIGVVLMTLVLLFDTSMVIAGKSFMFVLGPECYILGAI